MQHRHGTPDAAPRLQHRNAIHLRQADIQNDGVVRLGLAEKVAFLAVEGPIHHIAGVRQRGGELAIEIRIIFDNEEAHGVSPAVRRSAR